jgi:hypothetical protein
MCPRGFYIRIVVLNEFRGISLGNYVMVFKAKTSPCFKVQPGEPDLKFSIFGVH